MAGVARSPTFGKTEIMFNLFVEGLVVLGVVPMLGVP
jgi:hypothetical protein